MKLLLFFFLLRHLFDTIPLNLQNSSKFPRELRLFMVARKFVLVAASSQPQANRMLKLLLWTWLMHMLFLSYPQASSLKERAVFIHRIHNNQA